MPHSARAIITFLGDDGQPVDPSYGVPGYGSGRPDNSLPGGGYPSHGLPGGPITLPVYPYDPTVGVDNTLPDAPVTVWPPRPGGHFVVKYLACQGLILVPDNELPESAQPK